MSWIKPLLGLAIAAMPFVLFWYLTAKKRMPKSEDMSNYQGWSHTKDGK